MRLASTVGKGTTIELWLPRASAVAARKREAPDAPSARALGRCSVLLVDDHEGVRSTTAAMIADMGHAVHAVADGQQADDFFTAGDEPTVELLVTDYAMPHISGLEVIRRARHHVEDLPAIIVTGNVDAIEGFDMPEDVLVLAKPFTSAQLEAAIGTALSAVPRNQ